LPFWRAIFEKSASANLESFWLSHLKQKLNYDVNSDPTTPQLIYEVFVKTLRTLRNWASPGPDGIQGFWWKCFSSVHLFLYKVFNQFLMGDMELPIWSPVGGTLLIPKATDLTNPKNYRPITCLNIIYKLWIGCLTTLMLNHCYSHQILHPAQKGCSRGQLGCVDHLLLTNGVWRQVRSRNRSLSVAWINYRKAFDSVPHNRLLECLQLFQFPPVLQTCLERLVPLWRTALFIQLPSCEPKYLSDVSVRRGIFQGDTLSPLLFCLSLNPFSYLL